MNGKMILGIALLIGGIAGIYLVLTGKLPPPATGSPATNTGTVPGNFAGGQVTGNGTTIPGTTSGGSSPATATQGQKTAGSGGQSAVSVLASRPYLSPVTSSRDLYVGARP